MFKLRSKIFLLSCVLLVFSISIPFSSIAIEEDQYVQSVKVGKFEIEVISGDIKEAAQLQNFNFNSNESVYIEKEILSNYTSEKIEYNLSIDGGGFLELSLDGTSYSDGSFLIRDKNSNIIGFVEDIGAVDADNNKLEVVTVVNNSKITQMIKSKNDEIIAYPVTTFVSISSAEDYTYDDFFDPGGGWISRSEGISLSLYPTYSFPLNSLVELAWETVVDEFGDDSEFTNEEGMFKQFRCHNDAAAWKRPWNLEPWRPNVSYLQTVKALCNPEW